MIFVGAYLVIGVIFLVVAGEWFGIAVLFGWPVVIAREAWNEFRLWRRARALRRGKP